MATNENILKRIDLLIKEKAEKEEKYTLEIEEVIVDAKARAAVAIQEAKIKLDEDLDNSGSWNEAGWCEALAKISSKSTTATKDPRSQPAKEEKKNEADDDQAKVPACRNLV